jgi:VanZ like protein
MVGSEKYEERSGRRGRALFVASLLAIGVLTLTPGGSYVPREVEWCLACGDRGVTDALLNILLFMPLGAGLALMRVKGSRVAVVAFAISTFIETSQLLVIYGRTCSVGDIVMNTIGGVVGAACVAHWRTLTRPSPLSGARLGMLGAFAWLSILIVTALALQPDPSHKDLHVQFQPDIPNREYQFRGQVESASVGDVAIEKGKVPPEIRARINLLSGTLWTLAAAGPPPQRTPSIIVRVLDADRHTQLQLTQVDDALWFEQSSRTSSFRLGAPRVRLDHVFARAGREPNPCSTVELMRLSGTRRDGYLTVSAESSHCHLAFSAPLRPTLGWSFLLPFSYAYGVETPILSALWIIGLTFPWTYWLGVAMRDRRQQTWAIAIAVTALVVGLGLVPTAFSLPASAWHEWLAAGISSFSGLTCGKRLDARHLAFALADRGSDGGPVVQTAPSRPH